MQDIEQKIIDVVVLNLAGIMTEEHMRARLRGYLDDFASEVRCTGEAEA